MRRILGLGMTITIGKNYRGVLGVINKRDWLYEELKDSCEDLIRLDMRYIDGEEWNRELDSLVSFIRSNEESGTLSKKESQNLLWILGEI